MTERLYYTDSARVDFQATVRSVIHTGGRTALVLDRTAFYPTSGGQIFDTGTLLADTCKVAVTEVAEDEQGRVLHYVAAELPEGTPVRGLIDAERRRDHMQQHSGQHILSAAFVRLFDMPTVSFHMGEESCTIDLETKALSRRQAERAELLANEIVLEDRPVEVRFTTAEEASGLGVRKLPDAGHEKLRLVGIRDFDLTACGGTHVVRTGQVGAILVRKIENVKQGVRVEFVCGRRAVTTARRDFQVLTDAAGLLSTHIWELPAQIGKTIEDSKAAAKRQHKVQEEVAELLAARLLAQTPETAGRRVIVRSFTDRDAAFVKLLAQKLTASGPAIALLASTAAQPTLVFAQTPGGPHDMGALLKDAVSARGGRGGGTKDFAQGGVPSGDTIQDLLEEVSAKLR